MGLMEREAPGMVITPHPVTLDGQRHVVAELLPGEKLGAFLARTVTGFENDVWEVRINGVLVPHEVLDRVRPKQTALIEVRGVVKKQALMIVALIALSVFTAGIATAGIAALGIVGGTTAASLVAGAIQLAGTMLINKVLGPKPPPAQQAPDPVYSISSARNTARHYQPLPLLFGSMRIAPNLASLPYTWYEGNDQYMGLQLCAGVNIHSVEPLYNGDTLLSTYESVQVYHNGFSGMPDQDIPLYSNADSVAGAELTTGWTERTTPRDTVRVQVNLEYMLGGQGTSGKKYQVSEVVQVQHRATGSTAWTPLIERKFTNNNFDNKRTTLSADLPRGQYDIRVRITGAGDYTGDNTHHNDFQWSSMTCVQADDADYTGVARIGVRIKATGQLSGALDELRCVAHADAIPVWTEGGWVTQMTSNPGAQLLAYARGVYDPNGKLVAGIGLPDDQIDVDALKAFMLHCAAGGYTYDFYLQDERTHQEVVDAIALAGFGQSTWAGGKFGVVWAAQDQPLSGVVNMATIKRASFEVGYTLANAADGIEYSYVDRTTWQTATLRVTAPGVTTMLNPARVSGEGVTTEAHAARLARWHLAQSLYQYKDIAYSTDLEHLSYRRMSVLALQHDLTQWGYGGRLRAAAVTAGRVTLTLDEPVPAPATGKAYIGVRVPGERGYRVFEVQAFAGTTDTLTLVGPWPEDAALPGEDEDNPAHDTLWVYDFKPTPGYRVRVVSIEPEGDLQGASVAVVPESPEFWTYVLTGEYIPSPPSSLLATRPEITGLTISEGQVVQGDTVYTQLTATFQVSGPMAYCTVSMAQRLDDTWGELVQVAEVRSATATFRIPSAGLYRVIVRPYNADGIVGVPATAEYTTIGADVAPPPFDTFTISAMPGGVRRYAWFYAPSTMQAPDLAGAEIRFIAGTVPVPDWEDMEPIGDDGFHTSAFEAVVPTAGTWTFAIRARNTAGLLSAPTVRTVALPGNLGELVGDIQTDISDNTQQLIDQQALLDQEIADRFAADAATAAAAAADATAKANAALAAAIAQVDVVAAQVADILEADEWVNTTVYPAGDLIQYDGKLYRAKSEVPAGTLPTNTTYWEFIGNYQSLGEAVAASIAIGRQNISDIEAESTRLDGVVARMPAGVGVLATQASVVSEASTRASADSALGGRLDAVEVRMPVGSGQLATATALTSLEGRVTSAEGTLSSQGTAITGIQARMPAGSGQLATSSAVSTLDGRVSAAEGAITTQAGAITTINARLLGNLGGNRLFNPSFTNGSTIGWVGSHNITPSYSPRLGGYHVYTDAGATGRYLATGLSAQPWNVVNVGDIHTLSATVNCDGPWRLAIQYYSAANVLLYETPAVLNASTAGAWLRASITSAAAPSGSAYFAVVLYAENTTTHLRIFHPKMELGSFATPYSEEGATTANASATTALDARVTTAEGAITAIASSVTQVRAELGGGGNLLANTDFETDISEWNYRWNPAAFDPLARNNAGDAWRPINGFVIGAQRPGWPPTDGNGYCVVQSAAPIPIKAGDKIGVRVRAAAHRCGVRVGMVFLGPSNENLIEPCGPWVTAHGGNNIADWADLSHTYVAPANTRSVIIVLWVNTRGEGGSAMGETPFFWFFRPQLNILSADQTAPPPYSPGVGRLDSKYSAVTQSLNVRAATLEAGQAVLEAQYVLAVDVNGRVGGMRLANNGTQVDLQFLADTFKLVNPSGADSLTWENGVMVARSGAYMKVTGKGFGVGSALIEWYGPVMAISACSTSNSLYHMTKTGSAYFGGTLSAGTLHSAGRWNLNATNWTDGTYATCTHVGSNGAPKTIVVSAMIAHVARYAGNAVASYPARTGAITVGLFRGATELARWTVTATSGATFYPLEPGNPDSNYTENAQSWNFGSQTITDTISTAGDIGYTLKVITSSGSRYDPTTGLFTISVTE